MYYRKLVLTEVSALLIGLYAFLVCGVYLNPYIVSDKEILDADSFIPYIQGE